MTQVTFRIGIFVSAMSVLSMAYASIECETVNDCPCETSVVECMDMNEGPNLCVLYENGEGRGPSVMQHSWYYQRVYEGSGEPQDQANYTTITLIPMDCREMP
ncbi:unnamed protein product [marine sediment metagenome]|uniref:Uncharacterized protein n=1 Tax=marine sediment metagenome TaxID=412755 RepID=X0XCU1_9ZZZZ